MKKGNVLGIKVNCTDYDEVVSRVLRAAADREALSVSALAVHGVVEGRLDAKIAGILNDFDIICPDGQPVRWALRWLGHGRLDDRVYGPALMARICEEAAREGLPIYLYGSTSEILTKLQHVLCERYPGLVIAGAKPSRFMTATPDEVEEDARAIADSGARIVFCALGCPRQEIWCWAQKRQLDMPLLAVGAAFAFHAGTLPQAPPWMQQAGMEWFYRLLHEPRRLARRYIAYNPYYLGCLLMQKMKLRSYDEPSPPPDGGQVSIPG